MGFIARRKVFEIGMSRAVTLPKAWLDYHGREKTEEVTIIGDGILIIAPKGYEAKALEIMNRLDQGEVHLPSEDTQIEATLPSQLDDIERTPNELAALLGVPGIRVRSILRARGYAKSEGCFWGRLTPGQQLEVLEALRHRRQ